MSQAAIPATDVGTDAAPKLKRVLGVPSLVLFGLVYMRWFREQGFDVREPEEVNEGEGDFLLVGDVILAGTGFRSDSQSHGELERIFGREVVTLRLVDPSFYHLDTAVAVLDATTIAWLPEAFRPASRALLQERFPDAVVADATDAAVLGLNAVSDGRHVVLPIRATRLAAAVAERGFAPVPVDLSELLKGGG